MVPAPQPSAIKPNLAPVSNLSRRQAAVIAADVVDYSRLTEAAEVNTHVRLRAIRVRIVDPCQMNRLIAAHDQFALVEQHSDLHRLQPANHLDGVVVAQYPVSRSGDVGAHSGDPGKGGLEGTECFCAIVSRQYAEIIFEADDEFGDAFQGGCAHVRVQVALLAAAHRIEMSSHLFPEVSAHLLAATPTRHWLEWVDWAEAIVEEPLRIECRHFVDRVRDGAEPRSGAESGLRVVRVLEALQRSLEESSRVAPV